MLTGGPLQAASFFSTSSFSPPPAGSNNPIPFSCDPVTAGVTAACKALGALYGTVLQHAAMLAFVETVWLMGVLFLLMIPFLPLLQYGKRVPCQEARPSL